MSNNNKNKQTVAPVTEEIEVVEAPVEALTKFGQYDDEFADDADVLDADDLVVGRFKLVQGLTAGRKEFGFRDGQIYDSSTKKAYDSFVMVEVCEHRTVVERAGEGKPEKKGTFVAEHAVDSPLVVEALKRNNGKFGRDLVTLLGNSLEETRNLHFAMLDPKDGVTVTGFGILEAKSTNLYPVKLWKNTRQGFQRTGGKMANTLPSYAHRVVVDGNGVHSKNETALYRFFPFKNDSWKESAIDPDTCTVQERALLTALKAHKLAIQGGNVKVAQYSDADDSEAAQEEAAF